MEIVDKIYPRVEKINFINQIQNDSISILEKQKDFINYLSFIKNIEKKKKLKGSIAFGFTGNEAENSSLFIINTGMEVNYGIYPLEIEAKTNIQTQVSNGKFEENLSSLEISMDYHPFDNLTSEAYSFIIRTKNTFLGINQRYEIGGGYIFNVYSKTTHEKGQKLVEKSEKWKQKYSKKNLDELGITKCLKSYCKKEKLLSSTDVNEIFRVKEDHENLIKKLYSKHRAALLLGINYEIEKTQDSLTLFNENNIAILKNNFEATSLFRFVIAPKYELRGDRFKWFTTSYFKTALLKPVDGIYTNENILTNPTPNTILTDKKLDYWIDLKTSFTFGITNKLSFIASLNYIYDNAPKRQFYEDNSGIFKIAKAENRFTGINFNLKYTL